MKIGALPTLFAEIFGQNAASADITQPIPQTTNASGRASLDQGFPSVCFQPIASGGVPPYGQDFNGIFYMLSAAAQAQQAGVLPPFSQSFSNDIGGYALNAIVADPSTAGLFWISTADSNTSQPGASGANWLPFTASLASYLNTVIGNCFSPTYYTSSTSTTMPSYATRGLIRVIGPGGNGNYSYASQTTQISGGGGGAGADAMGIYGAGSGMTPGTTLNITVGTPGNNSVVSWGNNNQAITGQFGQNSEWQTNWSSAGAAGGGASGGNMWNNTGGDGADGQYAKSSTGFFAGNGAPGPFGGGGRAGNSGGYGGHAPGAGGGGSYDVGASGKTFNGGPGANGIVMITWLP